MVGVSVKYIWAEQLEEVGCRLPGIHSSLSAERITMYTVRLNTKTMSSAWSVFLSNLETSQVSPLNKNTI